MGEIQRGQIWWADLPEPSRIQTAIVAAIATNVALADAPGNVRLPARSAGLRPDSVVNFSQLLTLDRSFLTELAGYPPSAPAVAGAYV